MNKPHSASAERNREPILGVLRRYFADRRSVLEIGSGTGQHAVYFAQALPQLSWQTSELPEAVLGIRLWLEEAGLPNMPPPIELDVEGEWPDAKFDAVFSANTLHFMSWPQVERLFVQLPQVLAPNACVVIYGPFNYQGRFTSDSNAAFDRMLKTRAAYMGIRDFEAVNALAANIGLRLIDDVAMPANNRSLVWHYVGRRLTA